MKKIVFTLLIVGCLILISYSQEQQRKEGDTTITRMRHAGCPGGQYFFSNRGTNISGVSNYWHRCNECGTNTLFLTNYPRIQRLP